MSSQLCGSAEQRCPVREGATENQLKQVTACTRPSSASQLMIVLRLGECSGHGTIARERKGRAVRRRVEHCYVWEDEEKKGRAVICDV